jgi:hypothetical protein
MTSTQASTPAFAGSTQPNATSEYKDLVSISAAAHGCPHTGCVDNRDNVLSWFYMSLRARGKAKDVYHGIESGKQGFATILCKKRNEAALAILELYKYKGYAIPSGEFADFCINNLDYGRMKSIADMSISRHALNSGRRGQDCFYKDTDVQVRSGNQILRRIKMLSLSDVENEMLIAEHDIMGKSKWIFENLDGYVWIRLPRNTQEVDWWEGESGE